MNDTAVIILAILLGGAIALFVYGLALTLSRRVASIEKKYVSDAEQSLDSMFISLPVRGIIYLTMGAGFTLGMLGFIVSGSMLLAFLLTIIGLILPKMLINRVRNKRNALFISQLADVLLSLSNSLKAGYSISQAIGLISRETPNPAKQEFALVARSQAEALARRAGFDENGIQDIKSCVGEAVDNAIEHGYSENGVQIRYRISDDNFQVRHAAYRVLQERKNQAIPFLEKFISEENNSRMARNMAKDVLRNKTFD